MRRYRGRHHVARQSFVWSISFPSSQVLLISQVVVSRVGVLIDLPQVCPPVPAEAGTGVVRYLLQYC